ncbi:hypothetical protein AC792_07180 [Arthrobacter sp. RIT-PI-e]|nr:hypothetical protein AC792_07180 [Arthrobacter sp. RIT-PI-e]
MLLAMVLALAVLWWVVSEPAGSPAAAGPSVSADPPTAGASPPAGLEEGRVWFAELELDAGTVVTSGTTLRDVRAVGQDVVSGPDELRSGFLTVDATVPFDVVAAELDDGSVVSAAGEGRARVVRTVEALGREIRVVAEGSVEVADGRLVVVPRSIDVGGPAFLSDATAAVVRGLVTIEHEVEGLPDGLVLQDVTVQEDGFRVELQGEDVPLGR